MPDCGVCQCRRFGGWEFDAGVTNPMLAGVVTTQAANTGSQALRTVGDQAALYRADLQAPGAYASGTWSVEFSCFIDSTTFASASTVSYATISLAGLPSATAVRIAGAQMLFDPNLMLVRSPSRRGGGPSTPAILDTWVPCRFEIDLDRGLYRALYGGNDVGAGSYGTTASAEIRGVGFGGTVGTAGGILWDDVAIRPIAIDAYQTSLFITGQPDLTIDNVRSNGFSPATVTTLVNTNAVLRTRLSSGVPSDIAVTLAAAVGSRSGGITTPGGQFVNFDFRSPTLFWLNGGATPRLLPSAGSSTTTVTAPATPLVATLQTVAINPYHPDGFALSQACEWRVQ